MSTITYRLFKLFLAIWTGVMLSSNLVWAGFVGVLSGTFKTSGQEAPHQLGTIRSISKARS